MKEAAGDPVMALNPYTGKLMNVEPLFRFMQQGEEYEGVDDVIKYLSLLKYDEDTIVLLETFETRSSLFFFMYSLRDMFHDLRECEISVPKKKGGAS